MSHVSVELGHLYLQDLLVGPARLKSVFAQAGVWTRATRELQTAERARVSTCFLIDDYFSPLAGPDEVLPRVLEAAKQAGVEVDYLARESACAQIDGAGGSVSPATLLLAQLVAEPPPNTTGARPPAEETGWLSNGERSPGEDETIAMGVQSWRSPSETAARGHSVFVDVELWTGPPNNRIWSCALLAAAWQLLRLGLSRHLGEPLIEPADRPRSWPSEWSQLPGIIQLNPTAKPFAAYRTMSVLPARMLPVEQAVRTILGQVWHDPQVTGPLTDLAAKEGVALAVDALDRIGYVFSGEW